MSQPYDNTNKGVLFRNDQKRNDKDPDYRGNLNANGVEFWLSGWIRTPKDPNKKKFIGFSIKPKVEPLPTTQPSSFSQKPEPAESADEDIPF